MLDGIDAVLQVQPALHQGGHREQLARIDEGGVQLLPGEVAEGIGRQSLSGGACPVALHGLQQPHRLLDQQHAATQQVAQATLRAWVDVGGGQQAQPHQVGQMAGICVVVGLLEAGVLRHGQGVDHPGGITGPIQAVQQPVGVVGGLHRHALQLVAEGRQRRTDQVQIVGNALAQLEAPGLIKHRQHRVVGMQVASRIQWHGRLLVAGRTSGVWKHERTASTGRRRDESSDSLPPLRPRRK